MSYEKSTLNWYFIIKVYMFGHLSFFLMIQNFFYWTYLHFLLVTFESIVVIDLFRESFKGTKKIAICLQLFRDFMSKWVRKTTIPTRKKITLDGVWQPVKKLQFEPLTNFTAGFHRFLMFSPMRMPGLTLSFGSF